MLKLLIRWSGVRFPPGTPVKSRLFGFDRRAFFILGNSAGSDRKRMSFENEVKLEKIIVITYDVTKRWMR